MSKPYLSGNSNGRAKLTEDDVRAILESTATSTALGKQYEVSANTIGRIRRGETWKHLNISEHLTELSSPQT